jgi:2-isopropylmalate synthase
MGTQRFNGLEVFMRQIFLFDTTLRDGLKSPGAVLSVMEKVRIAKQLSDLRVDVVEVGFPAASEEQFNVAERIAQEVTGPVIAVLARATNAQDFEIACKAVKSATRFRIHTFVPASREYREHFLKKSAGEVRELATGAVRIARNLASDVEFSLVDAFRANPDEIIQLVQAVAAAGAGTINLADTVGYATPADVSGLFQRIRKEVDRFREIIFSVHFHNDLGLAVANSLTAIQEGASQIHCTINGIGERAGNTPLEELAAVLAIRQDRFNAQSGILMTQLVPACRLVRRLTGVNLQPHKPIAGANAFSHEPTTPQLADVMGAAPFQIISPQSLGIPKMETPLTIDSSLEDFRRKAIELGCEVEGDQLQESYATFQEMASRKAHLFNADLELLLHSTNAEPQRYRLLYLSVNAGSISIPHATVQLEIDGQVVQDAGFGHGPIDAAFKTIFKIVRRFPRLVRYEVNAVTPGTDAQGEVTVRLQDGTLIVEGHATGTDIVLESARALVDGLNRLEAMNTHPEIFEFTDEESWVPIL